MASGEWVPFGENPSSYHVLVDGVPPWLRPSLIEWIVKQLISGSNSSAISGALLHRANRTLRLNFAVMTSGPYTSVNWVREDLRKLNEQQLLRITDWILSVRTGGAGELGRMLRQAGSKWEVGIRDADDGLVARVAEGVQDAAEELIAQGGTPGKLLGEAWQKVHRLDPDDSGAYADAVKAVEVASFDALGIDNSNGKATLGNSIRAIETDPTWRLPFEREPKNHPTNSTLSSMLRTLFGGHRDRHGKADYSNVTHAEAEAAVNLAVTLVGWLTSSAVRQDWPEAEKY